LILLLDNKDSFVWNLAQALSALGARVEVRRSDAVHIDAIAPFAAIVLSPGPDRPEQAGCSIAAVRRWSGVRPILGVCLGHQAIASAFGGRVVRGEPCHGRTGAVHHDGRRLYAGLSSPTPFCRYHSLQVDGDDLPAALQVDARLADGTVMGLRHREHPTFGVQFHPESFLSPDGRRLLANFLREVA